MDYLILDEFQDFRDLYFEALIKWKNEFFFKGKFIILGDENQCINEFIGARKEYLLTIEKLINRKQNWKIFNMNISFRFPQQIANNAG